MAGHLAPLHIHLTYHTSITFQPRGFLSVLWTHQARAFVPAAPSDWKTWSPPHAIRIPLSPEGGSVLCSKFTFSERHCLATALVLSNSSNSSLCFDCLYITYLSLKLFCPYINILVCHLHILLPALPSPISTPQHNVNADWVGMKSTLLTVTEFPDTRIVSNT